MLLKAGLEFTLLNFVQALHSSNLSTLQKECICIWICVQLCVCMHICHSCHVLHCDIRLDNFVMTDVRTLENFKNIARLGGLTIDESELGSDFRDASCPSVSIIDFGRSVFLKQGNSTNCFEGCCLSSFNRCPEMNSSSPWSFEVLHILILYHYRRTAMLSVAAYSRFYLERTSISHLNHP